MSSTKSSAKSSKRKVDTEENTTLKEVLGVNPVDYLDADDLDNDADSSDEDSSVYSGLSADEEEDASDEEEDDDDEDDDEEGSSAGSDGEAVDEKPRLKLKAETSKEEATESPANQPDEYAEDSSDEEDLRNTVGNIPMKWYEEYPHIGYDLDGKPIIKPPKGDELDTFLRRMENPESWRTVTDPLTEQEVVLSDADVEAVQRLMQGRIPDASFEPYAPWVYWFSSEVMQTALSGRPEHKRSFIPSKLEAAKVGKMLHSIKMGWMVKREKKNPDEPRKFYMIWDNNAKAEDMRRIENHISAPKPKLPGHSESYNPPPEYLYNAQELSRWNELDEEPHRRKDSFIPQKFSSLRQVPAYDKFARERFERCLDLYLCPRARKMRLTIQPEDLVPQLPKPRDLQPFPTVCSLIFRGHTDMVRSISMDPSGQFFATGSDDQTVRIWEISTGRCLRKFEVEGVVRSVSWCPSSALALVAAAVDQRLLLLNPGVGDKLVVAKTDELLKQLPDQGDYIPPARVKAVVTWEVPDAQQWEKGIRVIISHFKQLKQVTWHGKGDYFACVLPEGAHRSVLIHQLSRRRSQIPFSKAKGLVQAVLFHPIRPYLFVATQRHVRIYNLMKQELSKKLMTGAKWVSSIAVHPAGDNIIVGTYDRRMQWFDLDLSTKPYQILRHHGKAIRAVAYHKRYPLFASGSDDASAIVCHGMVYNDLLQNPLIVPVKILRGHQPYNDFGVLDVIFHPYQPWLFTAGADSTVRLYT